ncbi:MAG: aminopeptidase P family protein [Synergistaceae bacterium]|jgi:Xaa-Pro aminopeptidase|nr:aminopeptidase P family protein [Synergistaceae bacterium]
MQFDIIHGRVKKLRDLMREREMDAFVLIVLERLNSESCHYISGFRGSSAALIIDDKRETLVTDGRYQTQAALQSPFALTVQTQVSLPEFVANAVAENGYKSVGFEAEKLFYSIVTGIMKKIPIHWKDASALIPFLRRTKDAEEADAIRRAGVIARRAYDKILAQVRVGMTEVEFESSLLREIKMAGAEKGWAHDDFIVVSGERGAMCHGRATERAFALGDTVTLDYGVMVDGYMCDITRNFAVGKAQRQALEIDRILVKAHRDAAAVLRPGVTGKEVDAVARKVITDAGYEKNFVHGLGHGLGLEVHEAPRLSFLSKDVLKEGDVVTVEPGIYIEGWGGLRVEDDYLVTKNGAECLTQSDDQHLRVVAEQ